MKCGRQKKSFSPRMLQDTRFTRLLCRVAGCTSRNAPTHLFFLRFDYIFEMFHIWWLDFTFVCLYAMHINYIIRKEQISQITVADSYYMHESFLAINLMNHEYARNYIADLMVMDKDKKTLFLPYHPM